MTGICNPRATIRSASYFFGAQPWRAHVAIIRLTSQVQLSFFEGIQVLLIVAFSLAIV